MTYALLKKSSQVAFFPLFLVFYEVSTYLSNDMYLPAIPSLEKVFDVPSFAMQYTLVVWFLGSASLQLFIGPLSDRFGRRPLLLISGALFVLANLLSAITYHFSYFLIARYFQGASVCGMVVAGYAAIHEYFDHTKAIKIFALMGGITILGPAFGPLLGALLLQIANWRIIFWVLAVWSSIAILALFLFLPETNVNKKQCLNFIVVFKNYFALMYNKEFMFHVISFCLLFAGLIAWVSAGTFFVMRDLHFSALVFGVCQLLVFGCYVISSFVVRCWTPKHGAHKVARKGYIVTSLMSIALGFLAVIGFNFEVFIALLAIYAFGVGLLFSTVQRIAIESDPLPMGQKMAVFFTCFGLFCILSSLLVSCFFSSGRSLACIIATLGVSGGIIHVLLPNKDQDAALSTKSTSKYNLMKEEI